MQVTSDVSCEVLCSPNMYSAPYLESRLHFLADFSRTTQTIAFIFGPLLGHTKKISGFWFLRADKIDPDARIFIFIFKVQRSHHSLACRLGTG